MLLQDDFVAQRRDEWQALEALLADGKALHRRPPEDISRVATLYRSVCSDLMRARASGMGRDLVAHLDSLAARAHNQLYGSRATDLTAVRDLVARDFPRTLRRHWRFFVFAAALFVVPLIATFIGTIVEPQIATEILPRGMLDEMARNYGDGFDGRDEGADSAMAGFYVYNNIGIAFRCFATGVLFGLGSVFFLVYNGLVIGAVLGWVTQAGHGEHIATFICGHGPFELVAIVISGMAGIRMGYSLVETNGLGRWASLRRYAPDLVALVVGAALMLAIAALVEGYWSPSGLAPPIKWTAGALFSVLVGVYITRAGRPSTVRGSVRRRPSTSDDPLEGVVVD